MLVFFSNFLAEVVYKNPVEEDNEDLILRTSLVKSLTSTELSGKIFAAILLKREHVNDHDRYVFGSVIFAQMHSNSSSASAIIRLIIFSILAGFFTNLKTKITR